MSRHPSRNTRSPFLISTVNRAERIQGALVRASETLRSISASDPHLNPAERKALLDYAGSCNAIRDGLAKLVGGEHGTGTSENSGAAVAGARLGDDREGV